MNIICCNVCEIRKCTRWASRKVGKDQYENIPLITDSRKCTYFQKPIVFKMPLLCHLIANNKKVNALNVILNEFKFRLHEELKYPYFRLTLSKK